jgi:hypothetical protein
MTTIIDATFDGEVFRPSQPVQLEPNTPVRLTVESNIPPSNGVEGTPPKPGEPYSALKLLASL